MSLINSSVPSLQILCARRLKNNWTQIENQIIQNEILHRLIIRLWKEDINLRNKKIDAIYKFIYEKLYEPQISNDKTVEFMEFMYPSIKMKIL